MIKRIGLKDINVSEINGSVKIKYIPTRNRTIKNYEVTLFRGSEEALHTALNGDILNLISFCDNGFNFNDLVIRHYGGSVTVKEVTPHIVYRVEIFID